MKYGPDKERSRSSVSMLAITFVVCGGVAVYIVLLASPDANDWVLPAVVSGSILILVLSWKLLGMTSMGQVLNDSFYAFWSKDIKETELDWKPKKVRNYRKEDLGNQAPPSADSVRDISTHGSTWVPSETGKKKKKQS